MLSTGCVFPHGMLQGDAGTSFVTGYGAIQPRKTPHRVSVNYLSVAEINAQAPGVEGCLLQLSSNLSIASTSPAHNTMFCSVIG